MKKLLLLLVVSLLVFSLVACGEPEPEPQESEPSPHEAEKVSVLDLEISTNVGIRFGDRCVLYSFANNSKYEITALKLTLKPRADLTEAEKNEVFALLQAENEADEEEMAEVKSEGINSISIEAFFFEGVKPGATSEPDDADWDPGHEVLSLDYQKYFVNDILEYHYLDETGTERIVYYDYINNLYSHYN